MENLTPFEKKFLQIAREKRWDVKQYFVQGKITLETVIEKLKQSGASEELIQKAIGEGMKDGSLSIAYQSNAFEKYVLQLPELREFRRNIQPFLTREQNERLVNALAPFLYAKLSDQAKKELTERMIVTKSLNLGYIRLPRASHRLAYDFIVKYPALFRHETEVLECMVERFIDEELSTTPIRETEQKIRELKGELKRIYGSVQQ
jgi:hypothetical protein